MCCNIFLYLGLERMIYPVTTFSCKVRCLAETKLAPGNIKSEYNFSNTFVLVVFCSLLRQYQIREWFVKEKQTTSVIKEIVKYYLCTGIPFIMWYVQVAWEGSCGNKSLGRRAQQKSLHKRKQLKGGITEWVQMVKKAAIVIDTKGRVRLPNQMNFWKRAKGGGVIFNPKIYIADFGNVKQAFLSMKLIQKSNFRVCFFNNCIEKNQNKTHFEEGTSEPPPLWNFRKKPFWRRPPSHLELFLIMWISNFDCQKSWFS